MDSATDTLPDQSASPVFAPLQRGHYLMRHWRGQLGLGRSYWVNCCLVSFLTSIILATIINRLPAMGGSLRLLASLSVAAFFVTITIWCWSIVGVWRSAGLHASRGGSAGWARLARVMVGIGVLTMVMKLSTDGLPQLKEFSLIAIGQDPVGAFSVKITANGQAVIFTGMLREGSARQIEMMLNAASGANSLILDSPGGRLLEAERIASIVHDRKLDTYVEGMCASACTLVFLAGKDRASTPNARIGFHQPSFLRLTREEQAVATGAMMEQYRRARLPDDFIEKISRTAPNDMWFPTREELILANVITRISLGGEAVLQASIYTSKAELLLMMRNSRYWQAIDMRFPGTLAHAGDVAWATREKGGNDDDMWYATRQVVNDLFPHLMKTADDDILEAYLTMAVSQLEAARALGAETCVKLLAAQLDVTRTLPAAIVNLEHEFLIEALNAAPQTDRRYPDQFMLDTAMRMAFDAMSPQHVKVIETPAAYQGQSALVCDANIGFLRSLARLPVKHRRVALRGIFQRS
ncbi:MAG: ATP-dependent Clp protease proteolytic subunit [Pseudomonadota bacterium]